MIGTIAKQDADWKIAEGSKKTIFINGGNQLQYSVKGLMSSEKFLNNKKFFTGYINNIEQYGIKEDYYKDDDIRVLDFEEIIENYLFIFNVIDAGVHKRLEDVALMIKPSSYEEGMTFRSMPYYRSQEDIAAFIKRWQNNQWLKYGEEIDASEGIPFILWQPLGTDQVYCMGGKTNFLTYQEKLYVPTPLNSYELTKEEKQLLILNPRDKDQELAFIETKLYHQLRERVGQGQQVEIQTLTQPLNKVINEEDEVLNNLMILTQRSGFTYRKQELINFHTALRTKSLVVLEGMSGTGKSRLVDFYRKALGLDDQHYKCISVRASWTDESDLLGYPDMMNNCYRPDHEGVVDLLLAANKHPEELYLLCFDEMNLAKVEHYFSQFLSVLEMDKEQQVLRLYNDALKLDNKENYPATITLKGNVLFVGTVNKDESTHHFSDKVLDRANVISLGVTSLKDLYREQEQNQIHSSFIEKQWTTQEYFGEEQEGRAARLTEEEIQLLEEVHLMLAHSTHNKGIGYRIVKQIEIYISKLPLQQTILNRQQAFDLQFAQRILSKIRGDSMSLEGILIREDEEGIPLIECLDNYPQVSEFELSKKMILQKAKALKCYGYTM